MIYTNSLLNVNLFYRTNQKVPISHLTCTMKLTLGVICKLPKHIGVLRWSEKDNFCLFLVLKRGT